MKYMGSKNRIAKYILPIMTKERTEGQYWVEPFVGGGNMIDKVDGLRIGADSNMYVIQALNLIKNDLSLLPKNKLEFSEFDYERVKNDSIHRLRGYVGFALSYAGKFFGGWCRDGKGTRDYVAEAYRNAEKQSAKIQDVKFVFSSFQNLDIPDNSIIYCDPPYKGTTKYNKDFNHSLFWHWCREKAKEGHKVFVSEYSAPEDFICVWEKEISSSLTQDTGSKKAIEKLFTL